MSNSYWHKQPYHFWHGWLCVSLQYWYICSSPNSMKHSLLEKLIVTQLVKKFSVFYGTLMFITVFTSTCHCSISWARCIQSTPSHLISLRSILILPSHLCLGLLSSLFPLEFLTKIMYAVLTEYSNSAVYWNNGRTSTNNPRAIVHHTFLSLMGCMPYLRVNYIMISTVHYRNVVQKNDMHTDNDLGVTLVLSSGWSTVLFVYVYTEPVLWKLFPGLILSSSSSRSDKEYSSRPRSSSWRPPRIFTPGLSSRSPLSVGVASWDHVANVNDPSKGFTIWKIHSRQTIDNICNSVRKWSCEVRIQTWALMADEMCMQFLNIGAEKQVIYL